MIPQKEPQKEPHGQEFPHARKVLDSEFHAVESGFQVL